MSNNESNELSLYIKLSPFFYYDAKRSVEILDKLDIYYADFADFYFNYIENRDISFNQIDIIAITLEYVLQDVMDKLYNDDRDSAGYFIEIGDVFVEYDRYNFDGNEKEIREAILKIKEGDRGLLLNWFLEKTYW